MWQRNQLEGCSELVKKLRGLSYGSGSKNRIGDMKINRQN